MLSQFLSRRIQVGVKDLKRRVISNDLLAPSGSITLGQCWLDQKEIMYSWVSMPRNSTKTFPPVQACAILKEDRVKLQVLG
jgi:hypothetical protein